MANRVNLVNRTLGQIGHIWYIWKIRHVPDIGRLPVCRFALGLYDVRAIAWVVRTPSCAPWQTTAAPRVPLKTLKKPKKITLIRFYDTAHNPPSAHCASTSARRPRAAPAPATFMRRIRAQRISAGCCAA